MSLNTSIHGNTIMVKTFPLTISPSKKRGAEEKID
jgi:hypothetical protein